MSTLAIVLIVVAALVLLLALGGAIARRRRDRAAAPGLEGLVAQANQRLAEAHAQDRGWEPSRLEAAARSAFAERNPGLAARAVTLIQVIDRPGTDDDKAVFRFEVDGGDRELTLGRRGDDWVAE